MGAVLEAEDLRLERRVALKFVLESEQETARLRLHRERDLLVRLKHPNVLELIDFGTFEGVDYLVTELVEGATPQPGFKPEALIQIFLQIGDALEHAHSLGLTHRDVKPANMMVEPSGRAVLLDFGLARAGDVKTLTRTGALMGSLGYLPPEIFQGEPASPSGDWYAWGVSLYQLTEGKLPFSHEQVLGWTSGGFPDSLPGLSLKKDHPIARSILGTVCKPPPARLSWIDLKKILRGQSLAPKEPSTEKTRRIQGAVPPSPLSQQKPENPAAPPEKQPRLGFSLVAFLLGALGVSIGLWRAPPSEEGPRVHPTEKKALRVAGETEEALDRLKQAVGFFEGHENSWKKLEGRAKDTAIAQFLCDPTLPLKWTRYLKSLDAWMNTLVPKGASSTEVSLLLEKAGHFTTFGIEFPKRFLKQVRPVFVRVAPRKLFSVDPDLQEYLSRNGVDVGIMQSNWDDLEERYAAYLGKVATPVAESGLFAWHLYSVATILGDRHERLVYQSLMRYGLRDASLHEDPTPILAGCTYYLLHHASILVADCEIRKADTRRILDLLETLRDRMKPEKVVVLAQYLGQFPDREHCAFQEEEKSLLARIQKLVASVSKGL